MGGGPPPIWRGLRRGLTWRRCLQMVLSWLTHSALHGDAGAHKWWSLSQLLPVVFEGLGDPDPEHANLVKGSLRFLAQAVDLDDPGTLATLFKVCSRDSLSRRRLTLEPLPYRCSRDSLSRLRRGARAPKSRPLSAWCWPSMGPVSRKGGNSTLATRTKASKRPTLL